MNQLELTLTSPDALGLCPHRWDAVLSAADEMCRTKQVPAISLQVQRHHLTTGPRHFGTQNLQSCAPLTDQTLFLVASLTKPIVAAAIMLLVDRGELALNQPVHTILPGFRDAAKRQITVKHLLTHTSGLPDMLPENDELRRLHAPLSTFVEQTCQTDLLFPPGRSAQYQSMGYTLLGEIITVISRSSCRDFLERELFAPLGMSRSWLGLPPDHPQFNQVAQIELPVAQVENSGWNWNSPYWRELGAPWGGVLSTASDLSRFLHMMLQSENRAGERGALSPASRQESLQNHLDDYPAIPDSERRSRGWGLGWRLNWKDHRSCFCDLLPGSIVGHWGATGTLFWLDRMRGIGTVLLSTRPLDENVSPLSRLSNMIAAAFVNEM